MLKNIFFFLLSFIVLSTNAQQPKSNASGTISGRIVDSLSAKPVEYATISLIKQDNNKVVNGGTTDDKGFFKITEVAEGTYKILVYFIGYQTKEQNNIAIDKSNSNLDLGDIKLGGKQTTLKEVTVTSEKSIIENKIDKLVYNAEQDVTSQTGVATDVLKKVPQVSIDVDGNVELQGSSSIRFLINGKPSVIFGNNIAEVLQSIPASQIKSIEVITSPGAKYDASGTGGIINIILKKSTAEGINGSVSLSAGTRLENGSLNLNAHHKHFGANAFINGNAQLPSTTINTQHRTSQDSFLLQSSQLNQNGTSDFSRQGFQSGIGFDWDITPKNNLSGSFGFDYFGNANDGAFNRNSVSKDSSSTIISEIDDRTTTSTEFHEQSYEWELNYKRKFKAEDHELEISYLTSLGNNYSHYNQSQKYISPDSVYSGSYGNNPGTENETNFTIDYTLPFGEDVLLETGAKAELIQIISNADVWLLNPVQNDYTYSTTQSLSLNYKSNVYAGYLSMKFKMFNWLDVKTGLRYEQTEQNAFFSNSGNVYLKPYGSYVPSGIISHSFKKNQTLKLSYSYRIERPEYRDLNPFVNASDPKNLTTGTTGLRPELGEKVEVTYGKTTQRGTVLNATLFYRGNKDDIQSFTRYYSSYAAGDSIYTNVAVTTRENVGRENNFGLNIFTSIPFTSKINFRTNISCFQRYIINGALPGKNVQGFNYRINANASYEISNSFIVELFGNFNSPRINAQGTMPAFTTYNFALRKQFLRKKASFALTATNFFGKYVKQETKLAGENFTLDNIRELPYNSFGINFTYKFGKLEFKKEKEPEDINLTHPPVDNQK